MLTYNNAIQTFPGTVAGGAVRLHGARVLRGRGRGATRGAGSRLRHLRRSRPLPPPRPPGTPPHPGHDPHSPPGCPRRSPSSCSRLAALLAALALPAAARADLRPRLGGRRRRRPGGRLARRQRRARRWPSPATSTSATATSRCARASRSSTRPSPSAASRYTRGTTRSSSREPRDVRGRATRRRRADRLVLHASDQTRAFTISYTLRGLAVAYDDVVDVNLKVWGDQWDEPLHRLVGDRDRAGKSSRAWGKPVWVRGDVELIGTRATLRAVAVPAHQFVELRTLVPRRRSRRPPACRSRADRLSTGSSPRSSPTPRAFQRDHDRIDALKAHPLRTGLVGSRSPPSPRSWSSSPSSGSSAASTGRATTASTSRSRRRTPSPRSSRRSCGRAARPGSFEFTATLFDLIRRGVYKAEPTTTERRSGAASAPDGLRPRALRGRERSAARWERDVADVVDASSTAGRSGSRASATASRTSASR